MNDWIDAEQHVERAHEHYQAGRWDQAESELRAAIALHPERAEWHFNLGLTLESAGRFEDAIEAYSAVHSLTPDDANVLLLLGVNCLRIEQPRRAARWFERASAADPDQPEPFIHLIEAYAQIGNHDKAEECFYRAIQLPGDHHLAYANIGESLMTRELYELAASSFRDAARRNPQLPRIHARLAAATAAVGRLEQAREMYYRELRSSPGDVQSLLELGCLLIDMGLLAEAAEKLRRVLEIDPKQTDAYFHLGEIASRQRRPAEAQAAFRKALELDREHPEVRRRLASIALREGNLSEARRLLRGDLRRFRGSAAAFIDDELDELANLLLDARLWRDAAAVFSALAERRPNDPAVIHGLSVALLTAGDRQAGMAACRRALRLDASHLPALHNMALACIEEKDWPRAKYFLAQAQRLDPDDAGLRRLRLSLRVHYCCEVLAWCFRRRA